MTNHCSEKYIIKLREMLPKRHGAGSGWGTRKQMVIKWKTPRPGQCVLCVRVVLQVEVGVCVGVLLKARGSGVLSTGCILAHFGADGAAELRGREETQAGRGLHRRSADSGSDPSRCTEPLSHQLVHPPGAAEGWPDGPAVITGSSPGGGWTAPGNSARAAALPAAPGRAGPEIRSEHREPARHAQPSDPRRRDSAGGQGAGLRWRAGWPGRINDSQRRPPVVLERPRTRGRSGGGARLAPRPPRWHLRAGGAGQTPCGGSAGLRDRAPPVCQFVCRAGAGEGLAEGASLSLRPTRALSEATAAAPTPGSPRKPCTSVISVSFNIFVCFSPFFAHSMVVVIVGGWELSFPDRAQASLVASSLLSS